MPHAGAPLLTMEPGVRHRLQSLESPMSKMPPRPWPDQTHEPVLQRGGTGAREGAGPDSPPPINVASICLQLKAGGDAAALTGIMKALLALDTWAGKEAGILDRDFITAHIEGFDALVEDLYAISWLEIMTESGLRRADLEAVALAYAKSQATIVTYGRGMTGHESGTAQVRLIADLLLMRGEIGRPGAGVFFLDMRERGERDGRSADGMRNGVSP